jgi:hypothetical protein
MKRIEMSVNTKLLGLKITNHLIGNNFIQMIPKSRGTCYVIRPVVHIRNTEVSEVIYFICLQSVIICRIFWGKFVAQ